VTVPIGMCTAFSAGACVDRRHRHVQPALASVAQGGSASAVRRSPRRTAEALRLGLATVRGCRRVGGRRVAGDRPTDVLRPRALRTATRLLPAGAAWKMRSCGMADAGHISSAHRPGCGGSCASAAARHWRGQCRMRGGGRRSASTGRSFRQCSGRAAAGAWLFPCGFAGGLSVFCRASRDCFVAIRSQAQASARPGRCANGLRGEARQRRHPRRDASSGDRLAPR